jgi:hypothetical protein
MPGGHFRLVYPNLSLTVQYRRLEMSTWRGRRRPAGALRARPSLGYRSRVEAFELDMAFAPEDVAIGLERLFAKLGLSWTCERESSSVCTFSVSLPESRETLVAVRPLPAERLTSAEWVPRTLLEAQTRTGGDLGALRRAIVLAFLRVTG